MVKDSKKYAATGGWGFAQFDKDGKLGGCSRGLQITAVRRGEVGRVTHSINNLESTKRRINDEYETTAQDKSKASEMTGTVCDQQCMKQDAGKNACDTSCTEHSGQAVFLDDSGNLWKVANPASCKGKMGKKSKFRVKKWTITPCICMM